MKTYKVRVNSGSRDITTYRKGTYMTVRKWVTANFPRSAIWSIEPC